MDWDDELDEIIHGTGHAGSMVDQASEGRLDPTDITDPASAYFLLSDDAQDEIAGSDKKRMECRACGRRFMGEIYDRCPECFSSDIHEGAHQTKNRYW
jgi:hypothetical protein